MSLLICVIFNEMARLSKTCLGDKQITVEADFIFLTGASKTL